MSHFWAHWEPHKIPSKIIRRDTRIYWQPQTNGTVGRCVGTFFGENPGGAQSIHGLKHEGYSPIHQSINRPGDPTLRLLLEIWKRAVSLGEQEPDGTEYIEVLNTYYFRNPKSGDSRSAWQKAGGSKLYFPAPSHSSRFVLLGWGKRNTTSDEAMEAVSLLRGAARVIIPNSDGKCIVRAGAMLSHPVQPGPVAPSYILRRSRELKRPYVRRVAKAMFAKKVS